MSSPGAARPPVGTAARVAAFGVGMALLAGLSLFLSWGQHQLDARRLQENRALMVARAVGEAARSTELKDRERLQGLAAALQREVSGLREIFVLKSNQYVAHSAADKAGKKLASSSLEDKALFDKSRRLQKAYADNVEALREHPELGRKIAAEQEVDGTENPVLAAVPVIWDDKVQAMVQATLEPSAVESPVPWGGVLAVAAGATVLLALALLFVPAAGTVAAVVLAIFAVGAALSLVRDRQREDWLSMVEQRARLAAAVARAFEAAGAPAALPAEAGGSETVAAVPASGPAVDATLLSAINVDASEGKYGDLLGVAKADGPAEPLLQQYGKVAAARLAVADRSWRVEVDRTALTRTLDRHAGSLKLVAVAALALVLGLYFFVALGTFGRAAETFQRHAFAYAYTLPAMIGMIVVVFVPFTYGLVLGFMRRSFNVWSFVGFDNFVQIVTDFNFQPRAFYFTFVVTVMWTVINVALHVTIGLALALLLQDKMLKLKAVYRVLLVVPWAVPSYITALIWQGMFHKEFGAINHYLGYLRIEPLSWFAQFWTAFAANVTTNTWLGFPFMMVISLGALQSIPGDLYEAASVDGASKWQQFRHITLPLLKPALFPAIILGTIWTFNQFNIIYLVSNGQPANSTDILVVEAYRKAFENDNYGLAAAYSTIIFVILLTYTLVSNRWTRATAGAYD